MWVVLPINATVKDVDTMKHLYNIIILSNTIDLVHPPSDGIIFEVG